MEIKQKDKMQEGRERNKKKRKEGILGERQKVQTDCRYSLRMPSQQSNKKKQNLWAWRKKDRRGSSPGRGGAMPVH